MTVELQNRTESHVRIYFERTRDKEISAMIPQSANTVEQAVEEFYKTTCPGASSYGRTIYADCIYVGDIWCYCINANDTPNAMLSYCIFDKAYWNKGIATEATRMFIDEIKERFDIKTLGAFAYCRNIASLKVLKKNGFQEIELFSEQGIMSAYYQRTT